ncbi:MAG: ribulose-phosphate 3-epimerase [Clostridia bacterium]|nr:ribulose-phosphate 3-epimerase [Clostridia bacterium]
MKVSPSILTCDFAHAADEVRFVADSGADMVHLDVMDGVFVPNLSFGPPVIASLRPHTDLLFDVHLMMTHPRRLLPAFAKAGADLINIHLECDDPIRETLEDIRALGKQAAITLKPATPAEEAFPYLELVDMVLVMTVEPGFGGQSFMADMMSKVTALRQEIDRRGLAVAIQVDGGIGAATAPIAAAAGADVAVMGSAVFTAPDPRQLVAEVQAL